jgi:2-C-methyl-D-erythritol 2,4-cyclodiphosphate synthase
MNPSTPASSEPKQQPPFRIGHGYDLHRLEPLATPAADSAAGSADESVQVARPLVIGGASFEHDMGPVGHSDGDVLLHAVTDAILGALALPDIGQLFPDSDPRWAGADSGKFLAEAVRLAAGRGWIVGNLDATVILERPKLGGRKEEIRQNIARILNVETERTNIKAKTHERVDAVGEGRAIEAHAVVLLIPATPGPPPPES